MEKIVFKYRIRAAVKIIMLVLIGLSLVSYLVYFAISGWKLDLHDLKYLVFIAALWIFMFVFQSDRSRIEAGNNCLKIRWVNWFRELVVPDTEIEKIILARHYISILRKGKKPLQMLLESLEKEDKTRLYEFLINYSNQKGISLERQLNP